MRQIMLVVVLCLAPATTALGWNATGHRVIASIAYRQLSNDEQGKVVTILERHPRFQAGIPFNMHANGLSEFQLGGRSRNGGGACQKAGEAGVAWGLWDA